jgi:hypothetical protein
MQIIAETPLPRSSPPAHDGIYYYDAELNPTEFRYQRWSYLNPEQNQLPKSFSSYADLHFRHAQAVRSCISLPDAATRELVEAVREEIKTALPGYAERRKQEQQVSEYLQTKVWPLGVCLDAYSIADKMHHCRRHGVVGVRESSKDHVIAWDSKCGYSKLCPDESRTEGLRLAESYIPALDYFLDRSHHHSVQFWVLTIPNVPAGELHAAKRTLFMEFIKLYKKNRSTVKGVLVVQEDPLAIDGDMWNVHLNAVVLLSGYIDWATVREQWGYNIAFYSESQMVEKTIAKLERKGIDAGAMTKRTVLQAAFAELAKYTTKLTGGREHETFSNHLKKAPPLVEWPALRFVEWWAANKGFRRTRSYGILYDPYKYRWRCSRRRLRELYLRRAKLHVERWRHDWKDFEKDERELLRQAMDDRIYTSLDDVRWLGTITIGRDFVPILQLSPIDSIQGDKSLTEYQRFRQLLPHILGPPP